MELSVLTISLNEFIIQLSGIYSNLYQDVNWLLKTLIIIEITLFGLWWALGADNRIAQALTLILKFGFWIWIIQVFPEFVFWIIDSFIQIGFRAVAFDGDTSLILNPSRIISYGLHLTEGILRYMKNLGITELGMLVIYAFMWIGIMISVSIIALQVFITVIEFYLIAGLSVILLPFAISKHTKFLAEKCIGSLISFGVKLMVLATLLGLIEPLLSEFSISATPNINSSLALMIIMAALAWLTWSAPGIAAGLLSGSPSLTLATAVQNTASAAMLGAGVASAGLSSLRAASSVAKSVGAGTIQLSGAVSSGSYLAYNIAKMGGAGTLSATGSAVTGGLKSAGSNLYQQTTQPLIDNLKSSASKKFSQGQKSIFSVKANKRKNTNSTNNNQSMNMPKWGHRFAETLRNAPHEAKPISNEKDIL